MLPWHRRVSTCYNYCNMYCMYGVEARLGLAEKALL